MYKSRRSDAKYLDQPKNFRVESISDEGKLEIEAIYMLRAGS
jgi:hypothetical protein